MYIMYNIGEQCELLENKVQAILCKHLSYKLILTEICDYNWKINNIRYTFPVWDSNLCLAQQSWKTVSVDQCVVRGHNLEIKMSVTKQVGK